MARVTDLGQIPEAADDIMLLLHDDPSMWLSPEAMVHSHSLQDLMVKVRQVSRMLLAAEERAAWEAWAQAEEERMWEEALDAEQAARQEQYAAEGRGLAGEYLDWDGKDVAV